MIYGMQYLHSNKNCATTLSITTLSKMDLIALRHLAYMTFSMMTLSIECRDYLNVILSFVMRNVGVLGVVKFSILMLIVIMLSVG
jgi:hypothetical protein